MLFVASATIAMAQPGQSHEDCLKTVAIELERSGESARDIAYVTEYTCQPTIPIADPNSLYARISEAQKDQLRELTRRDVQLGIMRLRACRQTAGCKANGINWNRR
jgi:hypothetical protein